MPAHGATLLLDADGTVRDACAAAAALVGRRLDELAPDWLDPGRTATLVAALRAREDLVLEDDEPRGGRWLRATLTAGTRPAVLHLEDTTGQRRAQWALRLREQLAADVPDELAPAALLEQLVRTICATTGLPVGEVWLQERAGQAPDLLVSHHAPSGVLEVFAAASRDVCPEPGSPPMVALHAGDPVLVDDLFADPGFQRTAAAQAAGLTSALYLPFHLDPGPVAAIGVFGTGTEVDRVWFELLTELHPDLRRVLRASRSRHGLERLFVAARDLLCIADRKGVPRRVNPAFERTLGWTPEQLAGPSLRELVHPDDRRATREVLAALGEGRAAVGFEHRVRASDGGYRWLRWSASPVDVHGLIHAVARDVTEERRDRAFERGQRELLQGVVGGATLASTLRGAAAFAEADHPGARVLVLLLADDRLEVAAGHQHPEHARLDGLRPAADEGPCGRAVAARTAVLGTVGEAACWVLPILGSQAAVLGLLVVLPPRHGAPGSRERQRLGDLAGLVGVAIERQRDDARLRDSEARFRLVAAATTDVVWDLDVAGDLLWWGPGYARMFGDEQDEGVRPVEAWAGLIHPEDRDGVVASLREALAAGDASWAREYRVVRLDGQVRWVADRGRRVGGGEGRTRRMIGGLADITERRELQQRTLRAQRMQTLGTLAGGVAHDLNNVLAPIVLAGDLLATAELPADLQPVVDTLIDSAERGRRLVEQVLRLARGAELDRRSVDLEQLVGGLQRFLDDTLGPTVSWQLTGGCRQRVLGDPTQLEQVVVNLVGNARAAMPDGGTLTIALEDLEVVAVPPRAHGDARPGRFVRVAVRDDGRGMDPTVRERLFEPFFTTREAGTGLGLATVLAIVQGHGGFLTVDSAPGAGTTVAVHLPAVGP